MSEPMPIPVVYVVDGCIIDLHQVATVLCYLESGVHTCRVILRSGVSFNVDMQHSRSLIQAVEWSRSPGSVAKPKPGLVDEAERVDNSWGN
jgi:hypothetical protein